MKLLFYFYAQNVRKMNMNKNLKKAALLLGMAMSVPVAVSAQDKVEVSVGADLTSQYIWRGQDLGGVSIQPSLTVGYKGLSLNLWASSGFDKEDDKEIDLTLAYETGGFTFAIVDYWVRPSGESPKYFHYGAHSTSHVFEAQIGYDFGPLALTWSTNFAGCDGVNKDGDRAYSSYISLTAPFNLGGLEWEAEMGATPWATDYYSDTNGFAVCDISLTANKELKITDSYSLPVFAKATWNPATEGAYFSFGLSF